MKNRTLFFIPLFLVLVSSALLASQEQDQWSKDLWCPRYTRQHSVVVKGVLEGIAFEKEYPVPGPDGLYPIPVEMKDSKGNLYRDVVGVIKDTKAPALRDIEYAHTTTEDMVTVKGFVDDKAFTRVYGISGRSGKYFVDLVFCDEAENCTNQSLEITKERKLQKLLEWKPFEIVESASTGYRGQVAVFVSQARQALVSVEHSIEKRIKESAPQVYAIILHVKKISQPNSAPVKNSSSPNAAEAPVFKPLTSLESDYRQKAQASIEQAPSAQTNLATPKETLPSAEPSKSTVLPYEKKESQIFSDDQLKKAEEAKKEKEKADKAGYQFGVTRRVRMPDERGGMTIIIDNHRTGQRTLIRKDLTGKEQSYERTEIPENERQRI